MLRGPDVAQVDGLAVRVFAQRVVGEVEIGRPGEGVGHYQRWRGQIRRPHLRVDAALEVAVATQHRDDDQVVIAHCRGHRLRQRPAISDAVMYRDRASNEGMLAFNREVENSALANRAAINHLERQRRQR